MDKKEHVEMSSGGFPMCRHCGGAVGADGYSEGGLVEEYDDIATKDTPDMEGELKFDEGDQKRAGVISPTSIQNERTKSFVEAMRRRIGGR